MRTIRSAIQKRGQVVRHQFQYPSSVRRSVGQVELVEKKFLRPLGRKTGSVVYFLYYCQRRAEEVASELALEVLSEEIRLRLEAVRWPAGARASTRRAES